MCFDHLPNDFDEYFELSAGNYFADCLDLTDVWFLHLTAFIVGNVCKVLLIFAGASLPPPGLCIKHCQRLFDLPMQIPLGCHNLSLELLCILNEGCRSLGNGGEAKRLGHVFHRLLSRSHLNIISSCNDVKSAS